MSEELHKSHEHGHHSPERDHGQAELEKLLHEKANEAKHEHAEQIDEIRQETRAEALPADHIRELHHKDDEPAAAPGLVNRDLKDTKYKRTLQSVRKDLSAPERALSKVVHNPVVDAISTTAEKTVARPSGLLAGSICAFVGSSLFLWIAKHYGYTYNFLLMTIFFAGGFVIGLLIEFLLRGLKKSPRG